MKFAIALAFGLAVAAPSQTVAAPLEDVEKAFVVSFVGSLLYVSVCDERFILDNQTISDRADAKGVDSLRIVAAIFAAMEANTTERKVTKREALIPEVTRVVVSQVNESSERMDTPAKKKTFCAQSFELWNRIGFIKKK